MGMHIFFSGIGGTAIGPLALIAKEAGYEVSGSDKQDSQYIQYLLKHGISDIYLGQNPDDLAELHRKHPVDWFVHTSVLDVGKRERNRAQELGIRISKRDELLNQIIADKKLKMIAVAGTHGKTTTTAMFVWMFKQLGVPISYSVGAKISFGDMGQFDEKSEYFVYEADEFDRNFLAFEPFVSVIAGVSWDHHEIFPTREDYQEAFKEFIGQSDWAELWQEDFDYLGLEPQENYAIMDSSDPEIEKVALAGRYNRLDAWLVIKAIHQLTRTPIEKLISIMNKFPGLQRRMEEIAPGLYSDYAHTPEKVRGAMSVATELAAKSGKNLVVVYEPLTNRRQHYMIDDYKDCFAGADKLYWIPSYLAREDPAQRVIPPEELISHLSDPSIAVALPRNEELKSQIEKHLKAGDMVVAMAGGGGDSLDEWLRKEFEMKIIQINAWLGAFTSQIIDVIMREEPDFVCMQEVLTSNIDNPLWPRYSMLQNIEAATNIKATFSPTYAFSSMGAKVSLGNAVFAKQTPVSSRTIFTHGEYIENQTARNFKRNIRNAQIVEFKNPGITIINHHGYHEKDPLGSNDSLLSIQKRLQKNLKTILPAELVCGDFNLKAESPALKPLYDLQLSSLTAKHGIKNTLSGMFRVKNIEVACDHIFINKYIKEVNFSMLDDIISDHKALVLEFEV